MSGRRPSVTRPTSGGRLRKSPARLIETDALQVEQQPRLHRPECPGGPFQQGEEYAGRHRGRPTRRANPTGPEVDSPGCRGRPRRRPACPARDGPARLVARAPHDRGPDEVADAPREIRPRDQSPETRLGPQHGFIHRQGFGHDGAVVDPRILPDAGAGTPRAGVRRNRAAPSRSSATTRRPGRSPRCPGNRPAGGIRRRTQLQVDGDEFRVDRDLVPGRESQPS